ncbi:7289_t:CDS:2, partial [Entrophospora sp. SA101]
YPYTFYAYGSRVKGTARQFSDLDICYQEDIPLSIISDIREELEESNLPFSMELRLLRHLGVKVNYVQNITDIDDKIIAKAEKEKKSEKEISNHYTKAYLANLIRYNISFPNYLPRVTDYIPQIQTFIASLLAKEAAYCQEGEVFFRIGENGEYGKLSGQDLEIFGNQTIDIHGGGNDLLFPHHENERIQYLAHNNKELSKEKYGANVLRYLIINTHYNQVINFNEELIQQGVNYIHKIENLFKRLQFYLYTEKIKVLEKESQTSTEVITSLLNNLNTVRVLYLLEEVIAFLNKSINQGQKTENFLIAISDFYFILTLLGFKFNLSPYNLATKLLIKKWQKLRTEDKQDRIIYIGKAQNLKDRVKSYFSLASTNYFCQQIHDLTIIITANVKEALILEQNLIKKHQPRFNILLKDSHYYPYLEITQEENPRYKIVRKIDSKKKSEYFGPFPDGSKAREILQLLERLFPLAKCKGNLAKPCFYYTIDQCSGHCWQKVGNAYYENIKQGVRKFFAGKTQEIKAKIKKSLTKNINNLAFEIARKEKKILDNIDFFTSQQNVEFLNRENCDFGVNKNDTIQTYLYQFYQNNLPPQVLYLSEKIAEEELLSEKFGFSLQVPTRGKKKKIVELARENAQQA